MESESSKTSNKKDPGWKYNHAKDPEKKYRITCNFCGFNSCGGIYRAKQHQMGGFSDVKPCEKVPLEVKEELQALCRQKQELNVRKKQNEPNVNIGDDADDVEVEQAERNSRGKRELVEKPGSSKAKKSKIVMDLSLQKPGEVVDMRKKRGKLRQTSMNDTTDTAKERTIQCIARFFDEAGIPFEAAQRNSFMDMVKAIGQYDLCLKPPSSHELRVSLNEKKMHLTKNLLKKHEEKWAKTKEDESTYDAAGSSGDPTAQSSPHNEEFQVKDFMACFGMPVIKEMWKAFCEAYMGINAETSKGKTEEEQKLSEEFKSLSESYPDMTEEGEEWLESCEKEIIGKWQERLKEFFEEEGITEMFIEKFKAFCLKCKEEDKRQYREALEEIEEGDLLSVAALRKFHPEKSMAGSLNVSFNCEGELQSSFTRTTPLTADAMKSPATGGQPHHDPLAMQGVATAAAESSGGLTTQSSPHYAKA